MSQTVSIIEAPCHVPIPDGLKVGHQIIIHGRVSDSIERFSFNIANGDQAGNDIAFHFNPRKGEQTVVRNTYHNGSWGTEERAIPSFEFDSGAKFVIRCLVKDNCYSVFVNGKHYIDYNHRLPIADVRCLELTTGADYDEVEIQIPVAVPFSGTLPRNFQVGDSFRVRGVMKDGNPDRFAIDLNTDAPNNIALHMNPRYSQVDVVFNSKTNGSWGSEQRGTWNPHFEPSCYFDIFIVAHTDHFIICVNDDYFTSYNYRLNVADISNFNIWGDVILMDVEFGQNMSQDNIKSLSCAMEDGDVIAVQGYFHEGYRFHIDLMNGHNDSDDVALHFNPRRGAENQIVFNTKVNGGWQTEERIALPAGLAAGVKSPFLVELCKSGGVYNCYLDGHKVYTFTDRNGRPVTGVRCRGEAYFYTSLFDIKTSHPLLDELPRQLETGSWVSVVCMPHHNSDRFAINLQDSDNENHASNIPFHFNPRFVGPVTVCNTLTNGSWGTEERKTDDFPFSFLERYEVNILVTDTDYRVFVNGNHYLNYAHRLDRALVTHVRLNEWADFLPPYYHF